MSKSFRIFAGVTIALTVVCFSMAGWQPSSSDAIAYRNAIVAFLVLGFLTEASYLSLRVGPSQTSSSVSFIPFLAAIILFDTGWAAAIAGASTMAVDVAVRKKPAIRTVFNVAQISLSVLLASMVYHSLGGRVSLSEYAVIPIAMAAGICTYFFINITAVSIAVALFYNVRLNEAWVRIAGASFVYDLFSSLLGPVLAFVYIKTQLVGILALILPLAFVRHIYQVNLQLEQVNRELLELMVKAIEARDPYTSGHSMRVSQIVETLAREYGLGHRQVEQVSTAALLHDVGKIHEQYAPLLRKEAKLDATETALMQTHSIRSAELVATISAFKGAITDAVRHHHENFDGTGYPQRLSGTAIPLGSRIIMIADTIDAMTTDRPYRKALDYERVLEELRRYSGRQFDPEWVEVCLRSVEVRKTIEARLMSQLDVPTKAGMLTLPATYEPRIQADSYGRGKVRR